MDKEKPACVAPNRPNSFYIPPSIRIMVWNIQNFTNKPDRRHKFVLPELKPRIIADTINHHRPHIVIFLETDEDANTLFSNTKFLEKLEPKGGWKLIVSKRTGTVLEQHREQPRKEGTPDEYDQSIEDNPNKNDDGEYQTNGDVSVLYHQAETYTVLHRTSEEWDIDFSEDPIEIAKEDDGLGSARGVARIVISDKSREVHIAIHVIHAPSPSKDLDTVRIPAIAAAALRLLEDNGETKFVERILCGDLNVRNNEQERLREALEQLAFTRIGPGPKESPDATSLRKVQAYNLAKRNLLSEPYDQAWILKADNNNTWTADVADVIVSPENTEAALGRLNDSFTTLTNDILERLTQLVEEIANQGAAQTSSSTKPRLTYRSIQNTIELRLSQIRDVHNKLIELHNHLRAIVFATEQPATEQPATEQLATDPTAGGSASEISERIANLAEQLISQAPVNFFKTLIDVTRKTGGDQDALKAIGDSDITNNERFEKLLNTLKEALQQADSTHKGDALQRISLESQTRNEILRPLRESADKLGKIVQRMSLIAELAQDDKGDNTLWSLQMWVLTRLCVSDHLPIIIKGTITPNIDPKLENKPMDTKEGESRWATTKRPGEDREDEGPNKRDSKVSNKEEEEEEEEEELEGSNAHDEMEVD